MSSRIKSNKPKAESQDSGNSSLSTPTLPNSKYASQSRLKYWLFISHTVGIQYLHIMPPTINDRIISYNSNKIRSMQVLTSPKSSSDQRIAVSDKWVSAVAWGPPVKLLRSTDHCEIGTVFTLGPNPLRSSFLWAESIEQGIKAGAPIKIFSQGTSFLRAKKIKSKENAWWRETGHQFWDEQQRKFFLASSPACNVSLST